ncbi:DUF1565 domain-containing protein [Roseibium sp. Sym1]|uniref:DUF1565 domain-containing protein n=1 Tax=Roseibium sp. Sym1 TaxID=3016006 RepID=UPI0022B3FB83|nr:DUF1565 domain-containing protein [Roseibium sp. Sym1]
MAYYVSVEEGDDTNPGLSRGEPLRSITRAMELISAAFMEEGDPFPETVHVAAGDYSGPTGERFPITVLPLVQVVGESSEDCSILFSLEHADWVSSCAPIGAFIHIYGSVSGFTFSVSDPSSECAMVILMDQNAVLDDAVAANIVIESARRVSNAEFVWLITKDGFESEDEVFPHIENCHYSGDLADEIGVFVRDDGGFSLCGGRLERSTAINVTVHSPSRTVVHDNEIDACHEFVVVRGLSEPPPADPAMVPQILDNRIWKRAELTGWFSQVTAKGESHWEGNTLQVNRVGIGCDCTFHDNTIEALVDFSLHRETGWAIGDRSDLNDFYACGFTPEAEMLRRPFRPVLTDNSFTFSGAFSAGRRAYMEILYDAGPVFEGNTFSTEGSESLVHVQNIPCFDWSAPSWVAEELQPVWTTNWQDFITRVRYNDRSLPGWIDDLPAPWPDMWDGFIAWLHIASRSGLITLPVDLTHPLLPTPYGEDHQAWIDNWRRFQEHLAPFRHWRIPVIMFSSDEAIQDFREEWPGTLASPSADFGGGGRSIGNNTFNMTNRILPKIIVSVYDNTLELWAENNTWSDGPTVEAIPPSDDIIIHI